MSQAIKVLEDNVKNFQDTIKQEQIDIINIKKILKDKVKNVSVYEGAIQMASQTLNLLKAEEEKAKAEASKEVKPK
jgi:hypothetical protein